MRASRRALRRRGAEAPDGLSAPQRQGGEAMALMDKLFGEFVDIIQWMDDTRDTMVYRFERHDNEIKHGAKLTVREGQAAVFVNEGEIADVFRPGMYTLRPATCRSWRRCRVEARLREPVQGRGLLRQHASGSPTSSGAPRTRSSCATRSSARSACARSAPTRCGSRTRRCSCARSSAPTGASRPTRSATSSAT